jgi:excisionase family DNA binding protein
MANPSLVKLIDEGALKARKVGRHRRVEFEELVQYKLQLRQKSDASLQRLSDLSQELGLY